MYKLINNMYDTSREPVAVGPLLGSPLGFHAALAVGCFSVFCRLSPAALAATFFSCW